jgi:hypothetical protein
MVGYIIVYINKVKGYHIYVICHWLRIITRLSGYVIENLTWILYTIFL